MRRYAWVTAVCLAALMAGGCGNQAGQETKRKFGERIGECSIR